MGIRDYYKQFEELSPEEASAQLRERADERRKSALARVEALNLSATTWPEYPHSYVVNAITFAARRGLHRYLDRSSSELRSELAHRHDIAEGRLVVGDGVAQLISEAAGALMEPEDELITPWPSYPLYPIVARHARGVAVPVPGFSVDAILAAVNDRTRLVTLCNPNDPTGELLGVAELERLLEALPERVVVLLDEALADYADTPLDASLALLERHSRLIVFRTLSKAWGLAGLRCGFAIGAADAGPMLERLEPELGVGELVQAGALEALRVVPRVLERRLAAVREERTRLITELRMLGLDVADSQANVLWVSREGVDGAQLAAGMGRAGVIVAPGGLFGDPDHVRVAVQSRAAGERLLHAARAALAELATAG
jgi:histidinol-phosphate aminotransferase